MPSPVAKPARAVPKAPTDRTLSFVDAVREAAELEMARDPNVVVFGLDVDDPKTLKAAYDELVALTVPVAEMMMTDVARRVLKDKTIDEVLKKG